jgi:hypothetical protein
MDHWTPPKDLLDEIRALPTDERTTVKLAGALGAVRTGLVDAPDELTARRHLAAMRETSGRNVRLRRPPRVARGRSLRTAAASLVTAATVLGGVGVAAANSALPGPVQHAVAGAAHVVGLDVPTGSSGSHHHDGSSDHRPSHPAGSTGERGSGAGLPGQGGSQPVTRGHEPGGPDPAANTPRDPATPPPSAPPVSHPTSPGNGGTPPGQATGPSNPGDDGTPPGQANPPANPGIGATPPGQDTNTTTPGRSGTAPGQPGDNAARGAQGNGASNGRG